MMAIFRRETAAYFKGIMGYLFAAFLLLFAGIYTMAYNLSGYYSNFEYVLEAICFIYLIAIPIISMRTVAEEKRQKTDQLLYSLPVSLTDVILGKYFAMLMTLLVPCAVMAFYPLILSQFGTVSFVTAYGTLLGFFMLGACLMSVGLFVSAMTESQVAAAVITLVCMLILYFLPGLSGYLSSAASSSLIALCVLVVVFAVVLYLLSKNPFVSVGTAVLGCGGLFAWYSADSAAFKGLFAEIVGHLSMFERFTPFVDGVFDLTAVVYFISVAAVFLFLSVQVLEKRRWSE